mgnify:CR=1 FL=1
MNPILALQRAKRLFPELRVGQIIVNATNKTDPYNIPDAELAKSIEDYCDRGGHRSPF